MHTPSCASHIETLPPPPCDCGDPPEVKRTRGPESLSPLQTELLGHLTEECGEVSQRVGKILRWGFDSDYQGSSQADKLATELGDVLASAILAIHNGLVSEGAILNAARRKLQKLAADAEGERRYLSHAAIPKAAISELDELILDLEPQ